MQTSVEWGPLRFGTEFVYCVVDMIYVSLYQFATEIRN